MLKEALPLALLLGLFCLRVAGQMLVEFTVWGGVLPPPEAWYSGLMPYWALLPSQWAIIALFAAICRDFWRGTGRFVRPHPQVGRWLTFFGLGYLGVMAARYGVRMTLHPHERWTGGSLPIFFHGVLATFVLVLAGFHRRLAPAPPGRRAWRVLGLALGLPAVVLWLSYLAAPHLLGRYLDVPPGPYAVRCESRVAMTMDDQVVLRAELFRPQHLGRAPTLLVRINHGGELLQRAAISLVGRFWAEHGYVVVVQAVRGRGESQGLFEPFVHERADGLATLRWLRQQSWFDGRVGTWGGSYFGYTQWSVADQPEVRAMMVQETATNFYDMLYPGGLFSLESALNWAVGSRPHGDAVPADAALRRGFAGFPVAEADRRAGHSCDFYKTWAAHPKRDGYWQGTDTAALRDTSEAQMFFLAGWFDPFLPSQLRDYAAVSAQGRARGLVIGPWCHACGVTTPEGFVPRSYRLDSLASSLGFFDAALRDVPEQISPVRYFMLGENAWHEAAVWPPEGAIQQRLRLQSAQRRLTADVAEGADVIAFDYDPNSPVPAESLAALGLAPQHRANRLGASDLGERRDALTFTTEPLATAWDLVGPQALDLVAASDAPCTAFTATLLDVWPDGRAFPYSHGAQVVEDAMQRQTVRIELWPVALRLAAGHRLAMRIASSSHPRFAAHPNVCGNPSAVATPRAAVQTLDLAKSSLVLSILPQAAAPSR